MADTPSEYVFKVRAMFNRVRAQTHEIVKTWQVKVATRVILDTPGPGNQLPETEYIATGRLRAGWHYSPEPPPPMVPAKPLGAPEDYDDRATATRARLGAEIRAAAGLPIAYLWNSVGYATIVHEGWGRHPYPRPWVQLIAETDLAHQYLIQAQFEVLGGTGAGGTT